MNNFKFRTVFLALLALSLICSTVNGAEPVATVVAARGNVQAIDPNGKGRKLAVRAPVFAEDTLQTDGRGKVQIMFTDNSLVSLGNATTMKITEYRWQPEQKAGALKTRIREGAFRVMGGALAQAAPQNFKTETPTATIGIRGSMYAGVATADSLSVLFQGGKGIEITNAFGTVAITQPGYGTKATLGNAPSVPVKFSAAELGELDKAMDGNGVGEKAEPEAEQEPEPAADSGASGQNDENSGGAAQEEPPPAADSTALTDPAGEDPAAGTSPETGTLTGPLATATDPASGIAPPITDLQTVPAQDTISTGANDTASTTGNRWEGNYRFFLRDIDLTLPEPTRFHSTFLNYNSGAVRTVLLDNGEISGTLASGDSFGPYLINRYDPAPTGYGGASTSAGTISYLDPTLGLLNLTSTTYADTGGQFFYNTIYNTIDSTPDYLISRLIYAGIPSTTIPDAGIDLFKGHLIYNNTSGSYYDADLEQAALEVSYYNRRIIGRSSEMDPAAGKSGGAIFFGTMNSDGSAAVKIIASGNPASNGPPAVIGVVPAPPPDIFSSYGTAAVKLYGDYNQGLGFTASGADYQLFDNTSLGNWEVVGGALRLPTTKLISNYPTAPLTYSGFVVGVADDTSTGAASRIFMNSTPDKFQMTANPTTGVLTGSISADDLTSTGAVNLANLTVGGTAASSAYISTEDMVAILSGSNLALSEHGNLLYNNGPLGPQITSVANDYLTWGYWEIAYTDPLDGSQDHLFSSQSFFVAGLQTDPAFISSIMNTAFTGTYTGKAYGVELDATGQNAMPLSNGTTNLTVNFQNPSLAGAVSGSINFDQAALTINSAANTLTSNGFSAYVSSVSGATPTTSAVNGAFYGPSAEGIGGNFNARLSTGTSYLGIFGGSR